MTKQPRITFRGFEHIGSPIDLWIYILCFDFLLTELTLWKGVFWCKSTCS